MWFFKPRQVKRISRNALRIAFADQYKFLTFTPLDMSYVLVPDKKWVAKRVPVINEYILGQYDCNHLACDIMSRLQSHCIGMAVIETEDKKVDHCLNVIVFEDEEILFFDARTGTYYDKEDVNIKRIWL